jgi:hypothetical protein
MVVWNLDPSFRSVPGQHSYFNGPPDNADVDELNYEDVQTYMRVCQRVRA